MIMSAPSSTGWQMISYNDNVRIHDLQCGRWFLTMIMSGPIICRVVDDFLQWSFQAPSSTGWQKISYNNHVRPHHLQGGRRFLTMIMSAPSSTGWQKISYNDHVCSIIYRVAEDFLQWSCLPHHLQCGRWFLIMIMSVSMICNVADDFL